MIEYQVDFPLSAGRIFFWANNFYWYLISSIKNDSFSCDMYMHGFVVALFFSFNLFIVCWLLLPRRAVFIFCVSESFVLVPTTREFAWVFDELILQEDFQFPPNFSASSYFHNLVSTVINDSFIPLLFADN